MSNYQDYLDWCNQQQKPPLSELGWIVERLDRQEKDLERLQRALDVAIERIRFLEGWNGEGR